LNGRFVSARVLPLWRAWRSRCLCRPAHVSLAQTAQTAQPPRHLPVFRFCWHQNFATSVAGTGEPVVLMHPFAASRLDLGPRFQDLFPNIGHRHDLPRPRMSAKPRPHPLLHRDGSYDVIRLHESNWRSQPAAIVGFPWVDRIAMKMLTEHPSSLFAPHHRRQASAFPRGSEHDETPLRPNLLSGNAPFRAMIASGPPGLPKPPPTTVNDEAEWRPRKSPLASGRRNVTPKGLWVDDAALQVHYAFRPSSFNGGTTPTFFESSKESLSHY